MDATLEKNSGNKKNKNKNKNLLIIIFLIYYLSTIM